MTNPLPDNALRKNPEPPESPDARPRDFSLIGSIYAAIKMVISTAILWIFRIWFVLTILAIICAVITGLFRGCAAFFGPLSPD